MNRQQIIMVAASVLAVVLIYQLPRVVVENESTSEVETHDFSISDEDEGVFAALRQQLKESSEIKKSINFADSLARLSLKYQLIDSAAKYADYMVTKDSSFSTRYRAGQIYYRAYQMTGDQQLSADMARKARETFEDLLEQDPENSSLKNKLAMTLIVTETPMAGVQLLRQVLAEDPNNREAILNLGVLAIQSKQFDRAEERFEKLLELDSSDHEALFYVGVAYAEGGKASEARRVFEKLINETDADPALKATASNYIDDL